MIDRERELQELARAVVSEDPAEVAGAYDLALLRMGSEPRARVLAATAYDRGRALAGREQKFGTQAVLVVGSVELWPVQAGTTDSERAKWGVPSLQALGDQSGSAALIGKAPLRRLLRVRRQGLDAGLLASWSQQLKDHGGAALQCANGAVVAAYWPLPGEADPRPLARLLARRDGARLALPVVDGDVMTFREWTDGALLEPAGFGTFGPSAQAEELTPTIILAPLLGFDRTGARLGQGGGYYDRMLASLAPGRAPQLVGIASSCQELPRVPTDTHDRVLDLLITEAEAHPFPEVRTDPGQETT